MLPAQKMRDFAAIGMINHKSYIGEDAYDYFKCVGWNGDAT